MFVVGVLALGDPKIDELYLEAHELWLEDLPVIPISEARKIIPFDTTYWTNWPSEKNPYINSAYWHRVWLLVLLELKPRQG